MGNHRFCRLLALCLAAVMVLGSSFAVSAANPSNTKGTAATVTNKGTDGNYGKKSIKVKFKGNNVTEYQIRYRLAGGKWKTITVAKSAKSKVISKLKDKGLYEIQVKAKGTNKKWSTAKVVSRRYMNTAKGVKVKAKKKAAGVYWTKIKGVSGYHIRYSLKKDMSSGVKTVKSGKSTHAKTLKNLKSGKTYYVQVRPYVIKNGKTYYGIYSTVKKIKVK